MKTTTKLFGLAVIAVTFAALPLTGCKGPNDPAGDPAPTVASVTVSPDAALVAKGGTQKFTAAVAGENNPAQTVT